SVSDPRDERELAPRQAALLLGISVGALTSRARDGRIAYLRTSSGHRRYRMADVQAYALALSDPVRDQLVADAVRLYGQGSSIRQVAAKLSVGYSAMRRILTQNTTLRRVGVHCEPADVKDLAVAAYLIQGYGLEQAQRLARWTNQIPLPPRTIPPQNGRTNTS
ncbi:MAG: helix-turn-helix domain-containing protein, partial [Actinoallomurus sp.]